MKYDPPILLNVECMYYLFFKKESMNNKFSLYDTRGKSKIINTHHVYHRSPLIRQWIVKFSISLVKFMTILVHMEIVFIITMITYADEFVPTHNKHFFVNYFAPKSCLCIFHVVYVTPLIYLGIEDAHFVGYKKFGVVPLPLIATHYK